METKNVKHRLGMRVLTPVHIGGGAEKDWIAGLDIIKNRKKCYKLNANKVNQLFAGQEDRLIHSYQKKKLGQLLISQNEDLDSLSDYTFDYPFQELNNTKSMIRAALSQQPYVPGSSIKGAIHSILLNYLGINYNNEKTLMGSVENGESFMRFLQIGDAHFSDSQLIYSKIYNLFKDRSTRTWKGGWKHKGETNTELLNNNKELYFTYECLLPGDSAEWTMKWAEVSFNLHQENGNFSPDQKKIINEGLPFLYKIINNHTKRFIGKEIKFFETYANDETGNIIEQYQRLLRRIPADNSFAVFRIGAGSGFHSITGDWQYRDFDIAGNKDSSSGKKKYKSRKIGITKEKGEYTFWPMGWVLIGDVNRIDELGLSEPEHKELALKYDNIEVWKGFITKYPNNDSIEVAKTRMDELIQEAEIQEMESKANTAFQLAMEKMSIEAWDDFIDQYPVSQLNTRAKKERKDLSDRLEREQMESEASLAFKEIMAKESIEQWESFVNQYPSSKLVKEVNGRLLKLRQAKNLELSQMAQQTELVIKEVEFKVMKATLNTYINKYKNFQFSQTQRNTISNAVRASWMKEGEKPIKKNEFFKKKKWATLSQYPWTDIVKWLGSEETEILYNELVEQGGN